MKKNVLSGKSNNGGGSGVGGYSMSVYECIFCGAFHVKGELCPELKKLLKNKLGGGKGRL